MNLHERVEQVEDIRFRVEAKSSNLGRMYADLGCTPDGLTVQEHIKTINEDSLSSIDDAAYHGAMTWLQAAEVTMEAMDRLLSGDTDG